MKAYRFKGLLQKEGWLQNAVVTINEGGRIISITANTSEKVEQVNGYAMPGFQNAHSHAFQFAMAGIAERHQSRTNTGDFWSWREAMYKLALAVDPRDIENIAAMVYAEMVRHGYTHVAEFHYLHHDKNGVPYTNLAEHGERLIAAAERAGIKITLLPMFYQKGGFDKKPQPQQRRFISATIDAYFKLLEASKKAAALYDGAQLGFGIHSLRAVQSDTMLRTIHDGPEDLPFHLHIAEQVKEIEDALAYLNKRPVQWLLENAPVNERFHLIHATHLIAEEVKGIARSGAHVVLCPSTEGNLGDGIFPLREFQKHGGQWSIGTDSHIGLSPLEEFRLLDYGQRLISHKRNTFTSEEQSDSGTAAYQRALLAGRKAMGDAFEDHFAPGRPLDAVVFDADAPLLAASSLKNLISTIVYAGDSKMTLGTMTNGEWKVQKNRHFNGQNILEDFQRTMKDLNTR